MSCEEPRVRRGHLKKKETAFLSRKRERKRNILRKGVNRFEMKREVNLLTKSVNRF